VFITRVLHSMRAAGVTDLVVVTGSLHARIVAAVATDPPEGAVIHFARNPDPTRGQLSSLLTGLDMAARQSIDAVLMTLVDVPFVAPSTIRVVVDTFTRTRAPIVRPARGDRHGHPVLFARALFDELRRANPEQGAKAVVRAHGAEIVNVQVDDEGALVDVDTRDEYERLVRS
jgi:molybdenum cofactor cytidylyltransferase